jgi:regulator of protease activity HflC (stomatin/prohibitin superfamily)
VQTSEEWSAFCLFIGIARLKAAAIPAAEGEKQAMIQWAEGTLAAARMEAEAQIILADASAKAIKDIADEIAGVRS